MGAAAHGSINFLDHNIDVAHDFHVREPQFPHTQRTQSLRPFLVIFQVRRIRMLSTIDLNRKARGVAVEIDDVPGDWPLPTKLDSLYLPQSKAIPEQFLCIGWFATHLTRETLKPL